MVFKIYAIFYLFLFFFEIFNYCYDTTEQVCKTVEEYNQFFVYRARFLSSDRFLALPNYYFSCWQTCKLFESISSTNTDTFDDNFKYNAESFSNIDKKNIYFTSVRAGT